MTILPRSLLFALLFGTIAGGCKCDGPTREPASQPSASAPVVASSAPVEPARVPRKTSPAPEAKPFEVKTADGVKLRGSVWSAGPPSAPAVVLAHRLGGDRSEWTPLLERLFPPKKPMNVVALDLRGHGASTERTKKPTEVMWQSFKSDDFERMGADVEDVLAWLGKQHGGPPTRLVLVGSDLGATAITRAAKASPDRVVGVALVSPGASLRGLDLYEPFGAVLALPNLILAAESDNVSSEPAKSLAAMSGSSTVLRFAGNAHGAEALGGQHWQVWDSLADWVEARLETGDAVAPPSSGTPEPPAPPATTLAK